jgi:hypothetical protein
VAVQILLETTKLTHLAGALLSLSGLHSAIRLGVCVCVYAKKNRLERPKEAAAGKVRGVASSCVLPLPLLLERKI